MPANVKELKQIRLAAEDRGWIVEMTRGNHLRWQHPSGKIMFTALTPSDNRALKNISAWIRKIEQGQNIKPPTTNH